MDFDTNELINIFKEETADIIHAIKKNVSNFEENRLENFKAILRGLHTIKGGAASVGYTPLRDKIHEAEENLAHFKEEQNILSLGLNVLEDVLFLCDEVEDYIEGAAGAEVSESHHEQHKESGFHDFSESSSEKKIPNSDKTVNSFIRVPVERIQKNFDCISEIFLTRNQINYQVELLKKGKIDIDKICYEWDLIDSTFRKNINELEQIAMSMRMMTISSLFTRMDKTVRGYCKESNKNIRTKFFGEGTEIDKRILDGLAEPFIHLTRNAMDHGIETPAEREKAGKSLEATIEFSATIKGNEIFVTIADDGKGMDPDTIYKKAKSKGVNVSHVKNNIDKINLIFAPGFSTAAEVTDISGRGVGLDAVKTYVEDLQGNIAINTELGRGTTFILVLPLSLSVVPALLAACSGQKVAVATTDIIETRTVAKESLIINNNKKYFLRDGEYIEVIIASEYLYSDSQKNSQDAKTSLCFVKSKNKTIKAIAFDRLLANFEIIAGKLPSITKVEPFISGTTILPTGEPVFVLNLGKFMEFVEEESLEAA